MLDALLKSYLKRFDRVFLLDLHSFMGPTEHEVCIGDCRGITCSPHLADAFHDALSAQGFDVSRDVPYSGGYTIRKYAKPPTVEALMIELRYTTYLDCTNIDEPGRPRLEKSRINAVQAKLRPAMNDAIKLIVDRAG